MKTIRFQSILLLIILIGLSSVVSAQDQSTPLIILQDGVLWQWSGDLDEPPALFDTCQPPDEPVTSVPVFSPDSQYIAFKTQPPIVTEAETRAGYRNQGAATPSNIWLCTVDSERAQLTKIASQPANASYFVEGVADRVHERSNPVWSSDGSKLAWTEVGRPDPLHTLVIYDLVNGTSEATHLGTEGAQQIGFPHVIMWGTTNIYHRELAAPPHVTARDANGEFIRNIPIPRPTDPKDLITDSALVTDGNREYIGLYWHYSGWSLLDPETGEMLLLSDLSAYLELIHPANPDGFSLLLVRPWSDTTPWVATADGLYISESGHTRAFGWYYPNKLSLSASGDIAKLGASLLIWRGDRESILSETLNWDAYAPNGLSWGPVAWRLRYAIELPLSPHLTCPNQLASRLMVGDTARVLPGDPNNLRVDPSPDAERLGMIPAGETVAVIGGPRCAHDLTWWEVIHDDQAGWTVEGQGDDYWLERVP